MHDWLTRNGWHPGRDVGERADELIQVRIQDAEQQGTPLPPVPAAVRVVHAYGLLELKRLDGFNYIVANSVLLDEFQITMPVIGRQHHDHRVDHSLIVFKFPENVEASACNSRHANIR